MPKSSNPSDSTKEETVSVRSTQPSKKAQPTSATKSATVMPKMTSLGITEDIYVDPDELTHISVKGAREHNLKSIDVEIPRNKLVVITGLSGSGKSSLAFDTLYAEGQRRYVECLSIYARQFLGMMKKPDVDIIEGLSPAISIEQKSVGNNPRSTVGTVTEIYDYLRLLYARVGVQYCVDCHIPVEFQSSEQILASIMAIKVGTPIMVLAPLVRGRKGHYRELFEQLMKQGYSRVRIDGDILELHEGLQTTRFKTHNIELIIDRAIVKPEDAVRISDSLELAFRMGDRTAMILIKDGENWIDKFYSQANSCPNCGKSYQELAPNNFSFNSPFGACQTCQGVGELRAFDDDLMMPRPELSLADGGLAPLGKRRETYLWRDVEFIVADNDIDMKAPISSLSKDKLNLILFGKGRKRKSGASYANARLHGVVANLQHQFETTTSTAIRKFLEQFMAVTPCPDCNGGRLRNESLAVKIDGLSISETTRKGIDDSVTYFEHLESRLNERQKAIAHLILKEIATRLRFLRNVGLGYLNLNRTARSLSGGESQRIRLASQIGSQLVGVMYVLDEPSIGLHQHDNQKLIQSLKDLRDLGNSVIVVEHDKDMIESADFLIDMGPGAGINGGRVVAALDPREMKSLSNKVIDASHTFKFLLGEKAIEIPAKRHEGNGRELALIGARGNNLQTVDLRIPLGKLVCVSGMSGSGKSTLINDTLYPILSKHFYDSDAQPLPYKRIEGLEFLDKVIEIDQSPIGRTPRSNPATYTGLFTLIRDFFTLLPESKVRGYKSGRFSFNVTGGRCDECEGGGMKKIEMSFLADVYVPCDVCGGARYNSETLQVKFKTKSIAEVLDMSVEEALDFFSEIPKIRLKIQTLYDVGLTYIKLGQQAPTLSGGEAQRVKLATELSKVGTGKTMYLLDEPTTGLHFEDIRVLMNLLRKLVDKGNTVIIIEHNLDVVKVADWVIDLGPEGGNGGGRIIAEGVPEEIVKVKESYTGLYLKPYLN